MLPILLINPHKRTLEAFIKKFIKEEKYSDLEINRVIPEKTIITIDQLRTIQSTLIRSSRQLIIVYEFDTARIESQNAFLKTLEEHHPKIQFILTASTTGSIVETVISRCHIIKLNTVKDEKEVVILPEHESLSHLLSQYGEMTKEKAVKVCDEWILIYTPHILEHAKNISFIKEVMVTRNGILKNNFNPQMAIDHLIILMKKLDS